jgi:hypothetical protein
LRSLGFTRVTLPEQQIDHRVRTIGCNERPVEHLRTGMFLANLVGHTELAFGRLAPQALMTITVIPPRVTFKASGPSPALWPVLPHHER